MFDSVLRPSQLPKSRFGSGTTIAILVHAGVAVAALQLSMRAAEAKRKEATVTFVSRPPPPPPPPPAAAPKTVRPKPKPTAAKPVVLQQAIVAPTVVPQEKPPEQEPTDMQPSDEGEAGGEVGGVPGGIQGGVVVDANDFNAKPPPPRIQLDESQVKLTRVSGPAIEYTDQAIEHEVEGTMIVKCLVGINGAVSNCRVLKSLPFMDKAVIATLERWHYQPYVSGGQPVEVDYTFKIRLTLPQ